MKKEPYWFVVHDGTDTVLRASECVAVDLGPLELPEKFGDCVDDHFGDDDAVVVDAAYRHGSPFTDLLGLIICPVGEVVGNRHAYTPGTGAVVEWSVMGDPRTLVEVCGFCVAGVPS